MDLREVEPGLFGGRVVFRSESDGTTFNIHVIRQGMVADWSSTIGYGFSTGAYDIKATTCLWRVQGCEVFLHGKLVSTVDNGVHLIDLAKQLRTGHAEHMGAKWLPLLKLNQTDDGEGRSDGDEEAGDEKAGDGEAGDEPAGVCPVCTDETANMALLCGHLFCEGCTRKLRLLHRTCPDCREPITGTLRIYFR